MSPQIWLRFALLTAFTLGFFLTQETVSSCVCIVITMVTTLLSTHHWIWKLSLPLIQYTELKHSSKIFLYSFSGQHCLALAVPQMATFITLAPERTLDKVKRLSIIATYHLDSFRGSFPSNNKTESVVFLPSTLHVHAAVATNLEGLQEIDEIDIPQIGVDGTASNGASILSTYPLLSFPNSKFVN